VVVLELGTRFAFAHISRIEHRIRTEHANAVAIRHQPGARSVLLVGNSLPLLAVDMDQLEKALPNQIRPYRFVIESTQLFDWKFGLRRIFADGARPDVIVVSVGATFMLPTAIRGDYSSYYLFRTADIHELADSLGYDNTRRSNLYFARYSLFFAGRAPLRNFILNRADPAYAELLHTLGNVPGRRGRSDAIEAASRSRLAAMKALAATYNATLVLLIPPGFARAEEPAVLRGAAEAGVPVIAPVAQGAWGEEMFSDGFHLNPAGAKEFTRLLAPQLAAVVEGQNHDARMVRSSTAGQSGVASR
jgi:hypothetical protein